MAILGFIRSSLCRFGVDRRVSEFGQRVVGLLLLGQCLIQKLDGVLHAELAGPALQSAVAGYLVVLYGLGGSQQASVKRRLTLVLVHDLGAFIEDALDGIALLSASRLADLFEDLLQPLDLTLGLVVVLLKCGTELIGVGGLGHLWQRFVDLL